MKRPIVLAGGGTGGHIYPAIAVARAIQKISPDQPIFFIGSKKGLETKIVPCEGFDLLLLPAGKLNRSAGRLAQLTTLFVLPFAFLRSMWIVLTNRPQAVLGVGGYASGPFVLIASLLGVRCAIWEPNAMPGLTNRILARFVAACFVVFPKAKNMFRAKRVIDSGVPIRFFLPEKPVATAAKRVLVFGGSQGARGINRVVRDLLLSNPSWLKETQWVHQIGKNDFSEYEKSYSEGLSDEFRNQVECVEFINDMQSRYEWADIVICRSGASTVAELAACGKVAILVPFPDAADNHQQKNAEQLVESQAGVMILQKDFSPELLSQTVQDLMMDQSRRQKISESVRRFHRQKAAEEIAEFLLSSRS